MMGEICLSEMWSLIFSEKNKMTKLLRIKIAKEYLDSVDKSGEPKKSMLAILKKYGIQSRASVFNYVKELKKSKI